MVSARYARGSLRRETFIGRLDCGDKLGLARAEHLIWARQNALA